MALVYSGTIVGIPNHGGREQRPSLFVHFVRIVRPNRRQRELT